MSGRWLAGCRERFPFYFGSSPSFSVGLRSVQSFCSPLSAQQLRRSQTSKKLSIIPQSHPFPVPVSSNDFERPQPTTSMPHRPNPIPRFNNPQYANTTFTSGQSPPSTVQNAPQSATNSSRRDLNTLPPRHRGHSFSATAPPSIASQDGNVSNRGERTGGASHRTLPPPRLQRKQRPPRVQSILAGHDNIDRSLGTLTFGPMTNWGVGTQSVVSLPMAAVNAASSAVALSASPQPNMLPSSNLTLTTPIDDLQSGFATNGITQISIDSTPRPVNNNPAHFSFGMSGSVPYSTSLPNPPSYLVSFPYFTPFSYFAGSGPDPTINQPNAHMSCHFVAARPITRRPNRRAICTVCYGTILCIYLYVCASAGTSEWRICR